MAVADLPAQRGWASHATDRRGIRSQAGPASSSGPLRRHFHRTGRLSRLTTATAFRTFVPARIETLIIDKIATEIAGWHPNYCHPILRPCDSTPPRRFSTPLDPPRIFETQR